MVQTANLGTIRRRRARWSVTILATLAGGCTQDLVALNEREPEPAFLGDLSGVYLLTADLPDSWSWPLGKALRVIHIRDRDDSPTGCAETGGCDRVVGVWHDGGGACFALGSAAIGLGNKQSVGVVGGAMAGEGYFDARFDGTTLSGVLGDGTPMTGRTVAGGGMLRDLTFAYRFCDVGPAFNLVATRVCEFNPALSGVYVGNESRCGPDAADDDAYLALGFAGPCILGLDANGDRLLDGPYDRYAERADCLTFPVSAAAQQDAWLGAQFGIQESGGTLHLSGAIGPWDVDGTVPLTTGDACDANWRGLDLTRMSGGDTRDCDPTPWLADMTWVPYLRVLTNWTAVPTRYLVIPRDDAATPFDPSLTVGGDLFDLSLGMPLPAEVPTPPQLAGVDDPFWVWIPLPLVVPESPATYLLLPWRADKQGWHPVPPECIVDDGGCDMPYPPPDDPTDPAWSLCSPWWIEPPPP